MVCNNCKKLEAQIVNLKTEARFMRDRLFLIKQIATNLTNEEMRELLKKERKKS